MSSAPLFSDRADAGEQLAESLLIQINHLREAGISAAPIVYALPRGGLPVAAPVARKLNCPLDIVVAKKITMPPNPELAIGAVTPEGHVLWLRQKRWGKRNDRLLQTAVYQAQEKAQAQLQQFSPGRPLVNPQGTLALLIDDGIALQTPKQFLSVSRFYEQFPQVESEDALSYLHNHNHPLITEN
jgi:predicted phosphoribosyltransferase